MIENGTHLVIFLMSAVKFSVVGPPVFCLLWQIVPTLIGNHSEKQLELPAYIFALRRLFHTDLLADLQCLNYSFTHSQTSIVSWLIHNKF